MVRALVLMVFLGFIYDIKIFPLTDFSHALTTLLLQMATTVFEKLVVSHRSNHFSKQLLQSSFSSVTRRVLLELVSFTLWSPVRKT